MAGIIVKSNATSGSTPDPQFLAVGELAFNSHDGRLFSKKQNGELVLINYRPSPTASLANVATSASFATNALTASFALNGGTGGSSSVSSSWASSSISASFAVRATSASFAATASLLLGSIQSASYAQNADLLDGLNSTVFATTGSNIFAGNQLITGSVILSSSLPVELRVIGDTEITGSLRMLGNITSSVFGTSSFAVSSSFATNALTASFALNATTGGGTSVSASWASSSISSSYAATASVLLGSVQSASFATNALTASFALNGGGGGGATALSGLTDVNLSGIAIGDILRYNGTVWTNVSSSNITVGTSSLATTSSYALTASFALNGGSNTVSIGTSPPTSPSTGSLWWNSEEGQLKIYYSDGDSSQWVDASGETSISGSIGGTPIYTIYDPLCPPAVPSSLDDEFDVDGISVPSGWVDVGALTTTVSVGRGRLRMSCPANAGASMAAIERTLPSGSFTVATRISNIGIAPFNLCSLYVRNSTTGRLWCTTSFVNSPYAYGNVWLGVESYSSFTTRDLNTVELQYFLREVFFRICFDGSTITAQFSHDGSDWMTMFSEPVTTRFTGGNLPDRVGFKLNSFSVNGPSGSWDFLRYFPTAFADIGRMINVG